jgi:hypothetical protein
MDTARLTDCYRYILYSYSAIQHTGIGFQQINGILAELNIPPVSKSLIHSRQEEIGLATESVAETSIKEALAEEVNKTSM